MVDIIDKDLIEPELDLYSKEDIIKHLAFLMDKKNRLKNVNEYIKSVIDRENLTNTYVGYGVGIPHGKTDAVNVPTLAFAKIKNPVIWGEEEDLANLIFMIAVPEKSSSNEHLKILAALSRKLMDEEFKEKLLVTNSKDNLIKILNEVFE